ncbi:MAG: type II toxin-antitoxin system VapC family toxin [Proteobacteria bacterium]|nr:type II toxin-antitoxin system VapC family toxin [Pseudomonadota bacterium]
MILYLDTSALVKLYVEEDHSELVRAWSEQAEILGTSVVALPEMMSALGRKSREGEISPEDLHRVRTQVEAEWGDYAVLPVRAGSAAQLALEQGLRGFDAIHLDAALRLTQEDATGSSAFASFDRQLNRAARSQGLTVLEPEDAKGGK